MPASAFKPSEIKIQDRIDSHARADDVLFVIITYPHS